MSLAQISPFATEHPTKGASPEPARRSARAAKEAAESRRSVAAETSSYLPHIYLQQILPLQLQLAAFLRSVDYRGLRWHLSLFRINTSKNFCAFRISLISGHLKSPIINTSVNFDFKLSRINTSKKTGGGGSSCNWLLPLQSEHPTPSWRASPEPACRQAGVEDSLGSPAWGCVSPRAVGGRCAVRGRMSGASEREGIHGGV